MKLYRLLLRALASVKAALQRKKVTPPELKAIAGDSEMLVMACQTLVSAYRRGGGGAGIDWTDLDLAAGLAAAALGESLDVPDAEELDAEPFLADAE